jgi:hypothetical protein
MSGNKRTTTRPLQGPLIAPPSASAAAAATTPAPAMMNTANMQAVVRLMTGVGQERTIAEKFCDSNRPSWEQYKRDNADKLNLDGVDQREMEKYRQELDAQRDGILARNKQHHKKRREDDDSDHSDDSGSDDRNARKRRKKKKRSSKHKKKTEMNSDDSDDDNERKKKKRKKSKQNEDDAYRLSSFFDKDD